MSLYAATPDGFFARALNNIRAIKGIRRMSESKIAEVGGFSSRQVLNNRLAGRTDPNLEDLSRIAAALRVEPHVLVIPLADAMQWIEDNPDYQPPPFPPQIANPRTRTPAARPRRRRSDA